jgi:hypothetical protein
MTISKSALVKFLLEELKAKRFFGYVQIKYMDGEPTLLRREETVQIGTHGADPMRSLRGDNRDESRFESYFNK